MFKYTFLLVILFSGISAVFAQMPDFGADQQRTEMRKLESMAGTWEGSGWIQQGKDKETFTGTEIVQRKIGDLALLVEGKFTNAEGKVIHQTLAVISYDPKQKIHRFRTYLANGSSGDHTIKLLPDGWEWGFETPGGVFRYIIKPSETIWSEIGEFSRDGGKTWVKFFEMNLKKKN